MYIRVNDVGDLSKVNRINYLFRIGGIKKYVDREGYVCFDQDEYLLYKDKKRGRKVRAVKEKGRKEK